MDLPKSVIEELQAKITSHQITADVHQRLFWDTNPLLVIILRAMTPRNSTCRHLPGILSRLNSCSLWMTELRNEHSACWWRLLVKLQAMNDASSLQAVRKLCNVL